MPKTTDSSVNISISDIWKARQRIQPLVKKTPLIHSSYLSEQYQASVYLKLENLHEIGAFKVRGAANKILSLPSQIQQKGITTFSTGNHGLAVAYIAKRLGIRAVICVSERASRAKVDAIKKLGAELLIKGNSQDDAETNCYHLQKEQGLTVIHPFDDREIIAGQGTIGLEILEDLATIDSAIIPLSGGGLLSGIGLALKANQPHMKVIGTSPLQSAVMIESLQAGKPVILKEHNTLADSLLGGIGQNNLYTFSLVKQYMDQSIQVSEPQIAESMSLLLKHHRLVVEGAAATTVAALQKQPSALIGQQIVLIISGCNVDLTSFLNSTSLYNNS